MTQIVVTLENNADENFLRRAIENMKGVVKTTLAHPHGHAKDSEDSQFLETLHSIKRDIDTSLIDYSDPRTNYIMSK